MILSDTRILEEMRETFKENKTEAEERLNTKQKEYNETYLSVIDKRKIEGGYFQYLIKHRGYPISELGWTYKNDLNKDLINEKDTIADKIEYIKNITICQLSLIFSTLDKLNNFVQYSE